ncbi:MAG TPA: DUF4097 family beta strand repeat-containing protein [Ilumatobacteraceae bacterium]|nr:DUF4097 family beta strand repeat-containing protein [Ilumatobacteraceae bacterium]
MITAFALAIATIAADTTVPATKSQRLDINVFAGSVTVRTWNRDAVKVEGATSGRDQLDVEARVNTISIETSGRHGPANDADLVVTVPVGMPIDVSGVELDVVIENCRCAMHVETVQGDVRATGGEGSVQLSSVEGSVTVSTVNGNLRATSVNDDVSVRDVTGDVSVETVNGDVTLERIRSGNVEGSTVNGDITFDGEVRKGGSYGLTSHQGDITMVVPANLAATIRVNTFNGSFESDFAVTLSGQNGRNRRLTFALGAGGATIDLESFSGDIRLVKPGSRLDRKD